MLKKTITYEDYNGTERTEDFYFNLTKVECMEIEFGFGPGESLSESIRTLYQANDIGTIIKTIKNIVLMAYGVKSPDGKRFIKNDEVREAFEQSPVFETVYWDLVTDAEKAAEFIASIVPTNLREQLGSNPKQELLNRMQEFQESGTV